MGDDGGDVGDGALEPHATSDSTRARARTEVLTARLVTRGFPRQRDDATTQRRKEELALET
jgi:hypothetical protein